MISRRNLLRTMLAASAAPAFVRADSLMKLWVPREPELILLQGDWTVETFIRPTEGQWQNIAMTISGGAASVFLDGKLVPGDHPTARLASGLLVPMIHDHQSARDAMYAGQVDDYINLN